MSNSQNQQLDVRNGAIDNEPSLAIERMIEADFLFARASADDLRHYSQEMLSRSAHRATAHLLAWTGASPSVTIDTLSGNGPGKADMSVLTVIDHDMPFLFDSVLGEATSGLRDLFMAVHPVFVIENGRAPRLRSPEEPSGQSLHVSVIQIHVKFLGEEQSCRLIESVQSVLSQVHLVHGDRKIMLAALDAAVSAIADVAHATSSGQDESLSFLAWLRDKNFVFLGMREYAYSGKGADATVERSLGRGLGILSDPDVLVLRQGKDQATTTSEILAFLEGPDVLIVTKANAKSVVHRRTYMDYIGVKRFDETGQVIGELRIVGLFTASAYTYSVREIPLLRTKAAQVEKVLSFDPESHSGRMLQMTLESYPRDDLFQIGAELLTSFCRQIAELNERPRVRVLSRIDRFDRFVSVIVYVPREDYDSRVREKVGAYLSEVYEGHLSAFHPALPDGGVARLHMIIGRTSGKTPVIEQAVLGLDLRPLRRETSILAA